MASSAKRVAAHRASLRAQGLRPIQIWVQDSSAPGFAERCRAWSLSLRNTAAEKEAMDWLEAVSDDSEWDSGGFDEKG
ncbi:antitoxin MazE family protein [Brevundimonas sp.]|uniref:antitoxin MazE family protein n=1 Tax=Brevundimonas sp. TaxID=1871086 RepID=UPI002ABAB1CD|nr:antitoxin MazE family protein [Brevundimonas sp.]MDZ4364202.1 antitoxin MazE family protein [Brevundimonas sp.]